MNLPFVSCICPTFNRISQLEEALECFLRQDYKGPKELVILNDCPNQKFNFDNPEVRIFNYSKQYSSLSEKHRDMVKLAEGDYISVWDDDDIKLPTALSFCVAMMQRNNLNLFYPDKVLISYENKTFRKLNKSSFHLNGMWTRALYNSTDGYHMNTEHPDGFLQELFLKKVVDFHEYPIDINDNYTILRVNSAVPQISFSHNEDDSSTEKSCNYRKDIAARAASKEGYTLNPHWDSNYVEDAEKAIVDNYTGPIYSASYNRRENKVTVHASECSIKVEYINKDTGHIEHTSVVGSSDDLNSVWVKASRVCHAEYQIKVYANNVLHTVIEPSLTGRPVLIRLDSKALGDTLAWFPYVLEFQKKHDCTVLVSTFNNRVLQNWQSEKVQIIEPIGVQDYEVEYKIGVFFDANKDPFSFREKPLQKVAADILGLTYREQHLNLSHLAGPRPIAEKYVVIGTTSTMGCKEWQNPEGWQAVVDYLKLQGYKVVCIPMHKTLLTGVEPAVPADLINGALTYIAHCEFFVGLSSALSWLARCLDKEVVMISGFTDSYNEFTCHRVINKKVCNSCYNDTSLEFGRHWNWCPRNKDFECTREISAQMVIASINEIYPMSDHRCIGTSGTCGPLHKQRILCILPHCSTGGLPQYFLEKLKILREVYDVYVVEWEFHGAAFSTQRNKIRSLCKEFIEMDNSRHSDIYNIISSINPNVIHFEELPNMYSNSEVFNKLHDSDSYRLLHTSHCAYKQFLRNIPDRYIFPSASQVAMYGAGEVLEYPIFDKFIEGPGGKDVLCLGIISPHKNQKWLVEIAKKMPDVTFHFVGAMAGNFQSYWRNIKPQANCVFHGEQDTPDIEKMYAKCSVLVHPSTLELCPLVFNEALSYGVNVIANWLPVYGYHPSKDFIIRMPLNNSADEVIRSALELPRQQRAPTYELFKQKLLDLYKGVI